MLTTLSLIKADIGSVAGHVAPSGPLFDTVREYVERESGDLLIDHTLFSTGDDIAILMSHTRGPGDADVHRLAWEAFRAGAETAKGQGLYGAGQDLLVDAFSGNVKGMGPGVAEIQFEERPGEPFLAFLADKTEPGAYNLPLYLAFADPMNTPGLLLSPALAKGFRFRVMDVAHTEGDRIIDLATPEDLYDLAALLRDNERFVVESVCSRHSGEQAVAVSTTRLHNIAGKYTGKDDPVMLVRVQQNFPATGEVLAPFAMAHYVGGSMRGSHVGPLMPVRRGSGVSYFDGPPAVSCSGFCVKGGRLTEPVDLFDTPFWDAVRARAAEKAVEMRRQGFSGPAMLPYSELEYGGIAQILARLDSRFTVRPAAQPAEAVTA
ncbi:MAG TPA: fructose-1,6-bisphosphate aldolase/phosphatase [Gemmataceae bacterium]